MDDKKNLPGLAPRDIIVEPPSACASGILFKNLREEIKSAGLDGLIVTAPANIYYLTGISNFDVEKGFMLIVTATDWKLVTSRFYQARVENVCPPNNLAYVDRGGSISKSAAFFVKNNTRIGFDPDDVSYAKFAAIKKAFKQRKILPSPGIIEKLRVIKNADEMRLIKKAAAITDKAFTALTKLIKPGVTEIALKRKIIEMMQDMGASGGSFDPIVASGKNAADPHYESANKKIKTGEMVLIDMGARYKNYDADMTRMVFVGNATSRFREVYNMVLETQEKALKDCVLGAAVTDIYDNCVANFKHYGQEDYFTHGLGHGVGIDIHEEPSLSPGGTGELENGMVFTIEPGLYYPGWGGVRIEDLCAMSQGRVQRLSRAPKRLIEV